MPSSLKPNVKNKFILTLLVRGTILQFLFETTGVQEHSPSQGFVLQNRCGVLSYRLGSQRGAERADFKACWSDR